MWKRLFQRLISIFQAKANDALDKAEDPVQMVKLAIAEMELSISKSTEALAKAMANQKNLKRKYDDLKMEADGWYGKAAAALKANQEDLAKKALEKKSLADKQVVQYESLSNNAQQTVEQLQQQLERMKTKLDEAKMRQNILIAKAENAKAQKEIAQQLGGIKGSAMADFNKYEDKINQLSAEAESLTEIVEGNTRLDREFEILETNSAIDVDFEVLKSEVEEAELKKKALEEEKKLKQIEGMLKQLPAKEQKSLPEPDKFFKNDEQQKKIDNFFKPNN